MEVNTREIKTFQVILKLSCVSFRQFSWLRQIWGAISYVCQSSQSRQTLPKVWSRESSTCGAPIKIWQTVATFPIVVPFWILTNQSNANFHMTTVTYTFAFSLFIRPTTVDTVEVICFQIWALRLLTVASLVLSFCTFPILSHTVCCVRALRLVFSALKWT